MSGLTPSSPRPTDIRLHQSSRLLEITFDDATTCMLSCEFLRVYSPSAEVRGHGAGQEVLQVGKEDVNIVGIEPVGQYAVKLSVKSAPLNPVRNRRPPGCGSSIDHALPGNQRR